ncbi:MAG TPA: sulfatase-like hydrolase/transferase [Dehalococcoidia bacterium]|nr:sulfatase-like hydrolase/transferase [Dehalococcoidia bacterium]
MTADQRPNLLVIMSDQHRPDGFSFRGSVARTPNIDRLAAEGLTFTHAYCQAPICLPSRSSFISERYVRDHGVAGNDGDLPHDLETFPQKLREAGYYTAMIGKCDLYRDRSVSHVRETIYRMNQYGFDEPIETGGQQQTALVHSEYTDFLQAKGRQFYETARDWSARYSYRTRTIPMWQTEPHPLPAELYLDSWVGQRTAQWIGEYRSDKPWFMWASFPGPHDPWDAPIEFLAKYRSSDIPPAHQTLPELTSAGAFGPFLQRRLAVSDGMTHEAVREMRRAYYANIDLIDVEVGRILDALEARGWLNNTWVVFTSDHGEMLADHGLLNKQVYYEPSVCVPLIVRPPGGTQTSSEARPVEQVDLSATLRAIAGAGPIIDGAGCSLAGHFGNGAAFTRNVAISSQMGFAMFATERYKLVVHEATLEPCQLFDLELDPEEDRNLVHDEGHAQIRDELLAGYVRPFFSVPARTADTGGARVP